MSYQYYFIMLNAINVDNSNNNNNNNNKWVTLPSRACSNTSTCTLTGDILITTLFPSSIASHSSTTEESSCLSARHISNGEERDEREDEEDIGRELPLWAGEVGVMGVREECWMTCEWVTLQSELI